MYRPKPNKEQDYPKTQVTNQQIKCFLWQIFVKHEADKDIQTTHDKNTDYLNMNNHLRVMKTDCVRSELIKAKMIEVRLALILNIGQNMFV